MYFLVAENCAVEDKIANIASYKSELLKLCTVIIFYLNFFLPSIIFTIVFPSYL